MPAGAFFSISFTEDQMKTLRRMKKSRERKQMNKATFTPGSQSKYAVKKELQFRGSFSHNSPFRLDAAKPAPSEAVEYVDPMDEAEAEEGEQS